MRQKEKYSKIITEQLIHQNSKLLSSRVADRIRSFIDSFWRGFWVLCFRLFK